MLRCPACRTMNTNGSTSCVTCGKKLLAKGEVEATLERPDKVVERTTQEVAQKEPTKAETASRTILSLVLGIGAALGVGAAAGYMRAEVFFLILVFPALMGLAIGIAYGLPKRAHSDEEALPHLMLGLVLGALSYSFSHWVAYEVVVADLPADIDISFWSYLKEVAEGTEVGRRASGFSVSGGWAWALWAGELALTALVAAGASVASTDDMLDFFND